MKFSQQYLDERSEKQGDCVVWLRGKVCIGYGRFGFNGRLYLAHRVAKYLAGGATEAEFSNPKVIFRHKCNNPSCIKPSHIILGTQLDNMRDRDLAGRTSKGMQRPGAKLSNAQVREIKKLLRSRFFYRYIIADAYGVAKSTIQAIDENKKWKHV